MATVLASNFVYLRRTAEIDMVNYMYDLTTCGGHNTVPLVHMYMWWS